MIPIRESTSFFKVFCPVSFNSSKILLPVSYYWMNDHVGIYDNFVHLKNNYMMVFLNLFYFQPRLVSAKHTHFQVVPVSKTIGLQFVDVLNTLPLENGYV